MKNGEKGLKICFWNIAGITTKCEETWEYLEEFDIISIQYTLIEDRRVFFLQIWLFGFLDSLFFWVAFFCFRHIGTVIVTQNGEKHARAVVPSWSDLSKLQHRITSCLSRAGHLDISILEVFSQTVRLSLIQIRAFWTAFWIQNVIWFEFASFHKKMLELSSRHCKTNK